MNAAAMIRIGDRRVLVGPRRTTTLHHPFRSLHDPMTPIRPFRDIAPRLGARAYVDPAACVIGDVDLGEDASVWPGAVLRGDVNFIRVGARTSLQDGSIVHVSHDGPYTRPGRVSHDHRLRHHGGATACPARMHSGQTSA